MRVGMRPEGRWEAAVSALRGVLLAGFGLTAGGAPAWSAGGHRCGRGVVGVCLELAPSLRHVFPPLVGAGGGRRAAPGGEDEEGSRAPGTGRRRRAVRGYFRTCEKTSCP